MRVQFNTVKNQYLLNRTIYFGYL